MNGPGQATPRTIVGMSGGVDSSVAALLLRDAGEPVAGLFMDNWADDAQGSASAAGGRTPGAADAQDSASVAEGRPENASCISGTSAIPGGRTPEATDDAQGGASAAEGRPENASCISGTSAIRGGRTPGAAGSGDCRAQDDRRDAVAVCGRLGIPIHFRDFSGEYRSGVFEHFLAEYAAGRTPNPDVLCNREIKFRHFLDAARALGAGRIATGHYARIDRRDGRHRLLRAVDRDKDQSYFLHQLGQEALAATVFPLGELAKPDVRRMARDAGLPTAAKKDSTGICFIGERDFREFLSRYIPARPGEIRDPDGHVLGEHPGVFHFTLGQRGGLQLGGVRGREPAPWYVVAKDVENNVLTVAQGGDSPYLMSGTLWSEPAHWIAGTAPAARFECRAQTRYRQDEQACEVMVQDDGKLQVRFARPQRAVTPGQSLVLYDGEECLGGAVIAATDAPLEQHPPTHWSKTG